jgi:hypothetical protein
VRYRAILNKFKLRDYHQNMTQMYGKLQEIGERLKTLDLKLTDDLLENLAKKLNSFDLPTSVEKILKELKPNEENSAETQSIISI